MPSELYSKFVASSAWSNRHSLPLCPPSDNPWIYGAYALKVMRAAGIPAGEEVALLDNFRSYANQCRIVPGLFNRSPDRAPFLWTSHDELMGMAYTSSELAQEIVKYLIDHHGVYTNLPEDAAAPDAPIRFNLYRFPWLLPYLKARAGYYVTPLAQLIFAAHLLNDIRVTEPGLTTDAGGRLRIWLMLEAMEEFWISKLACLYWKLKMNRMGYSPKNQLKIEPGEHPILSECAPDSF